MCKHLYLVKMDSELRFGSKFNRNSKFQIEQVEQDAVYQQNVSGPNIFV